AQPGGALLDGGASVFIEGEHARISWGSMRHTRPQCRGQCVTRPPSRESKILYAPPSSAFCPSRWQAMRGTRQLAHKIAVTLRKHRSSIESPFQAPVDLSSDATKDSGF